MAIVVRIFRPAKTAMQAGSGNTRKWVLEFEPTGRIVQDALMGWSGSEDTRRQVRLTFASREEALACAERQGWVPKVSEPHQQAIKPKAYADNFAFKRIV